MPTWTATVCEADSGELWHTEVRGSDEQEALQRALDIFLQTEDREDVEFDYSTLGAEQAS